MRPSPVLPPPYPATHVSLPAPATTAPQNAHHPPKVASTTGQESEVETLELDKNRQCKANKSGLRPGAADVPLKRGARLSGTAAPRDSGRQKALGQLAGVVSGRSVPPCPMVDKDEHRALDLCPPLHPIPGSYAGPGCPRALLIMLPCPYPPPGCVSGKGMGTLAVECQAGPSGHEGWAVTQLAWAPSWSLPLTIQEFGQLAQQ